MAKDSQGGSAKSSVQGFWGAATVGLAMGALVGLVALALNKYATATDAATILGIAVPAVVSVGAAAFGIAVAYNAASVKTEAEQKQQAAENAQQETENKSQATAAMLTDNLNAIERSVEPILSTLQERLPSHAGREFYSLDPSQPLGGTEPLVVSTEDIVSAKQNIASARDSLRNFVPEQHS